MGRTLTTIAAILVTSSPTWAHPQYGWTISASGTDPYLNSMTLEPNTPFTAYVWDACDTEDGVSAAEFAITIDPLESFAATPVFSVMGYWLWAGSGLDCIIVVGGCPRAPILAGTITGFWTGAAGPAHICFGISGINDQMGTVDCDLPIPTLWPIQQIGLGVNTAPGCVEPLCQTPVSMTSPSWGRLKGLYR
jgi:hypothetical protein